MLLMRTRLPSPAKYFGLGIVRYEIQFGWVAHRPSSGLDETSRVSSLLDHFTRLFWLQRRIRWTNDPDQDWGQTYRVCSKWLFREKPSHFFVKSMKAGPVG